MTKTRGFEKINTESSNDAITLPVRATKASAGYDFEASERIVIPSIFSNIKREIQSRGLIGPLRSRDIDTENPKIFKPTLVPTGVKSYMPDDEYLQLANRSSNPLKRFLLLANGVGIIDSDYYSNPNNDGHIMFQFINFGLHDVVIEPGDKIGQGIFHKFLKADNDSSDTTRVGGFGSTSK